MNDTDTTHTETDSGIARIPTETSIDTIATADLAFDRDGDTLSSTDHVHSDESNGSPFVCSRCTRPFAHEEWLDLHRGLTHTDLTTDEHESFVDAYEDEEDELRLFRLKALIALIAVYFGFIMTYSIFA